MKTPNYVGKDREKFLKWMLKQEPHSDKFLGHEIIVLPQVFLPSTPSELLAKFARVRKGIKVADIGTGTGVLALIAGLKGAVGYATDVNPIAVKNARLNLDKYGIPAIKTLKSDLFSSIPSTEVFDMIMFNRPFWDSYDEKKMEHISELGFSDPTGKILPRFLKEAKSRLAKKGTILLSAAEWEPLSEIERIFEKFGYIHKMLGKLASRRDKRRVYRAYELKVKTR